MTLQIQHELDSAQRDRDEALRREHDGAREQARLSDMKVARVGDHWRHRPAAAQTTHRCSAALLAQTTDADAAAQLAQQPGMTSMRTRLKFVFSRHLSMAC